MWEGGVVVKVERYADGGEQEGEVEYKVEGCWDSGWEFGAWAWYVQEAM